VRETAAHAYAGESWVARHGTPRTAAALAALAEAGGLVGFEPVERFARHLRGAGIAVAADAFRLVSENSVVLWEMVRHGLGAGIMLRDIAERTPGVVRLAPSWPGTKVPIWLVTHRELGTSRRVRLVFDILAEELARAPGRARQRPST
jgi:DNA-binding transcriptional LysR family regulator